jgi:hypothetical protein
MSTYKICFEKKGDELLDNATSYRLDDRCLNPGKGKIFCRVQDVQTGPGTHRASYTMGTKAPFWA